MEGSCSLNATVSRMDSTLAIVNESDYLLTAQVPRVNVTVTLSEMDDTIVRIGTTNCKCVIVHTSNIAQFLSPICLILLTPHNSKCMNT